MLRPAVQTDIPVLVFGNAAAAAMAKPARGRVTAVFRSCFYVDTGRGQICIGNETLEPSPLTCVSAAPEGTDWSACGIHTGDCIAASPAQLFVANRIRFAMADARIWAPAAPASVTAESVARGLAALRSECAPLLPSDGLGRFILPGFQPDDPVTRAAQQPISSLRSWLAAALGGEQADSPDGFAALVGLGPGLTPSGDDHIAGALIALHSLGRGSVANDLWSAVHPHAAVSGNTVSAAYLLAASKGQGSASHHRALCAILEGQRGALREALAGIARYGHSSGWDGLAGAVTACELWLECSGHRGKSHALFQGQ